MVMLLIKIVKSVHISNLEITIQFMNQPPQYIQLCSLMHFIQGFFNPDLFDGVVQEVDGLTVLEVTLFAPPGLTADQFIMGATDWYYNNFTATGNPMTLGPIEVLWISLNGD